MWEFAPTYDLSPTTFSENKIATIADPNEQGLRQPAILLRQEKGIDVRLALDVVRMGRDQAPHQT
ncbi:MAG: hypothetical protein ABSH01_03735 [Terriglobia bacterium]|jgi:hypothetical protein